MPHAIPPKNWRATRLFVGAVLGFTVVVMLGVLSVSLYTSATRRIDYTIDVRRTVYEWMSALYDAESEAHGYLETDRAEFLTGYERAAARERDSAEALRRLVMDDPKQTQNVDALDRDARTAMARLGGLIALARSGKRAEALERIASTEPKREVEAFRRDADRVRTEEDVEMLERRSQSRTRASVRLAGALVLTVFSSWLLVLAWRSEQHREATLATLAIEARWRLRTLSDLAAALADARSPADVARIVVERGMLAAGADTCTLHILDDSGAALELIGVRGVAPELVDKIRRITETSGSPETFATLKSGTSMWAEDDAAYAALQPELASMEERRARAFWSVPLFAEDRTVGLLGAGFYQPRTFSDDERAFVETLARQCAQALLRASRMDREDAARRLLVTTLRSIGDAVIATDAQGAVTFMNPVAEALTGWDEGDSRGRPLDAIFHIFSELTLAPVESPVTKVLREGAIVGLANHTVLRTRRGAEIPIADSGAPIRNEAGSIIGVVLVFRDVSAEKQGRVREEFLARAGEALVSSIDYEATLAAVARLAVPAIADWCTIDLADPGGPRQVAVAHADPHKMQFAREAVERHPPDPSAVFGAPQVIRTGKAELYTELPEGLVEAAAKDAEHLELLRDLELESAMIVPLRARGRVFGAITFVYASSGRHYSKDDLAFAEEFARRAAIAIENALAVKDAEEARAKESWLRSDAELANRSKDDFLATVSHELRTPLNAILGWTVMLRSHKPADDIDRGLVIIERNARSQAKLIDDVLDVSRVTSGKLALSLGPTRVADVIAAAIETVTPAASAKGVVISSDVSDTSLTITADADRMQQIVWNLLSNAVKFTPRGRSVLVEARGEGSDVCVRVSDTGEGIRPEVLPNIFEPFKQADASTTRRHGGLGLGLAIVKQLVSAHGGTVQAASDGLGKGAAFEVRLPARSLVPAVGRAARAAAASSISTDLKIGPRIDGLRLLVVDDEYDARALVSQLLQEHGAEVHVAASANEALELFARVRPDVMVSDVGMPEVDGYALIRTIRALSADAGGRTPAVALTAFARTQDAQRAFAAGYQMHVTKPVEPADLVTVVANLAGRSLDG